MNYENSVSNFRFLHFFYYLCHNYTKPKDYEENDDGRNGGTDNIMWLQ